MNKTLAVMLTSTLLLLSTRAAFCADAGSQSPVDELRAKALSVGIDIDSPTLGTDVRKFVEQTALLQLRERLGAELEKYGLDEDSTWSDVRAKGKEPLRRAAAHQLGLDPAAASWNDIAVGLSEKARQGSARRLGLASDATWEQVLGASKAKTRAASAGKPKLQLVSWMSR